MGKRVDRDALYCVNNQKLQTEGEIMELHELEGKVARLENRIEISEKIMQQHLEVDRISHSKIDDSLLEIIKGQERTNSSFSALIEELREPLEDFRMRAYGMKYLKNTFGNIKYVAIVVLGTLGVLVLMNLTTIIKVFGLVS